MEKLKVNFDLLIQALETLGDVLNSMPQVKSMKKKFLVEFTKDATIQRFEYCFDSFWKFLKKYLETIHGHENLNSPRTTFQAYVKLGLCSEKDSEKLMKMHIDRNETTHNYDAHKVRKIFPRIKGYYTLMLKVIHGLPGKP